jgi:uncharacterized protein YidB (DUF937 family)
MKGTHSFSGSMNATAQSCGNHRTANLPKKAGLDDQEILAQLAEQTPVKNST